MNLQKSNNDEKSKLELILNLIPLMVIRNWNKSKKLSFECNLSYRA